MTVGGRRHLACHIRGPVRFVSDFALLVLAALNGSALRAAAQGPWQRGRSARWLRGLLCQLSFVIDSVCSALLRQVINTRTSVMGEGVPAGGFLLYLDANHPAMLIWCIPISGMRCSCISVVKRCPREVKTAADGPSLGSQKVRHYPCQLAPLIGTGWVCDCLETWTSALGEADTMNSPGAGQ